MSEIRTLPDLNNFRAPIFRNVNDYLKEKIIAANPSFNRLKWDHFDMCLEMNDLSTNSNGDIENDEGRVVDINTAKNKIFLTLKDNAEIKRMHRNPNIRYEFTMNKIYMADAFNRFAPNINGGVFRYEDKDRFKRFLTSMHIQNYEIRVSADEVVVQGMRNSGDTNSILEYVGYRKNSKIGNRYAVYAIFKRESVNDEDKITDIDPSAVRKDLRLNIDEYATIFDASTDGPEE